MYQNGDTVVVKDGEELISYIKQQFNNGATLIMETKQGLKTIKVRQL